MRTLQCFTDLDAVARRYDNEWDGNPLGILSEHVHALAHLGAPRVIGGHEWMVPHAGGRAYRVVCSEGIPIYTEDGVSDGRCGQPANVGGRGTCDSHDFGDVAYDEASAHDEWVREMTERSGH